MKRIIFILVSVIALASCRSDMQGNDALLDRGIKVFRYDRLQYEATAMNSIAAVQRMNLDCPQATRILIEDVLMLGKVNDPNINERMCAYYADSILFRLMQDAIARHEGRKAEIKGDTLFVDGQPAASYSFSSNYYWMVSNNSVNRNDSRQFGFVPESHLIGKAAFVWLSKDPDAGWLGGYRWNRFLQPVK